MFPFVVSYDSVDNVTNVSGWLPRPAGGQGFVRAADGHFATDAGPLRFWATNLCFDACFPTHQQAERLAARLARLGINCVRMHHMDNHNIWGRQPNHLTIDPEQLERLDYLIYQLKLHGVYVNLNLHVSRWLDEKDGFPQRNLRPTYDKGLDNFCAQMIAAQRDYARQLLTHVNPYTQTAYVNEPAIAFVEINNENSLYSSWGWGALDNLPDPYATEFRTLWNAWLKKKYGSTDKLRETWNVGSKPLGAEMLTNGDFAQPVGKPWNLELDGVGKASWSVQPGGPEGKPFLRVAVEKMGKAAWVPQFAHAGLAVKKESPYTLTCLMRSDKARRVSVNCMMAHEPWNQLGFSASAQIGPEWKPVRFTFMPNADDENARITFTSLEPGTYELSAVSLKPGGILGLQDGQKLEDASVPIFKHGEMTATAAARADWADFMWDTEHDYWTGMCKFLKETLGVKSLVAGTQLGYSPVHIQAALDFCDNHSYWQHPSFPGRDWDMNNWTVNNIAMVNQLGGTLAHLATFRVLGKPYTVSEYNHPAPNAYSAEGFPMIAAFGAFQGWDGIYSFAYSHSKEHEARRITSFFDISSHAAKIVQMPACAAMFLRGDVAPARENYWAPLSPEAERRRLRTSLDTWGLAKTNFGLRDRVSLTDAVSLNLDPKTEAAAVSPDNAGAFVSDTRELRWDTSEKGAGYYTVSSPRSKLFTGFVKGRTFDLGGVALAIGQTKLDWATVTMTCMDGKGFDQPGRILITATGWVQNTGWDLKDLGGNRVTLGTKWGTEPELCEGIPAEIVLPVASDRVKLFPLDEAGNRRAEAPVAARDGKAIIRIGPEHKTVWYEVEIK